jgi:mannitol/fructose-specific phosphotransferase system IIA component (Ntr-type)
MIMFISPVKPDGPHEHLAFISHVASRIKKSAEAILNASNSESLLSLLGMELILGGVDEP